MHNQFFEDIIAKKIRFQLPALRAYIPEGGPGFHTGINKLDNKTCFGYPDGHSLREWALQKEVLHE
jgi:hypothetical protein